MIISPKQLCSTNCNFTNLTSYRMGKSDYTTYNYEGLGRGSHLLFYQIENKRTYSVEKKPVCTIGPGDIVFIPQGTKYISFCNDSSRPIDGIGISFNLEDASGNPVLVSGGICLVKNDSFSAIYKRFKGVHYSVINPAHNSMRLKGEMYSILDELFAIKETREDIARSYGEILDAIRAVENDTNINYTTKELAQMCHMSESSFIRKFKSYSGGITPVKYRNKIRLTHAEEMANSDLTLNEIAERLGFYDGAHLCKIYKQEKGHTLKYMR